MLVALFVALAFALALWFLPVQVQVRFWQDGWQATAAVEVQALLLKFGRDIHISELVNTAIEHALKRWFDKGEPLKVPLQKTVRRAPRGKILRAVRVPLRYLGRRTRCRRLMVRAVVGGGDAMESALLAGGMWAVVGALLGRFTRWVRIEPQTPSVEVKPDFRQAAWRVETDCILRLQFGHAIVAVIWILRRVLSEKEVVAWARDAWRRKGVNAGDRGASDSRPDENGHGEH